MLPPFLGMLLFLGTALMVAIGVLAALGATLAGKPLLRKRALQTAGAIIAVYAVFWLLGPLVAPLRVLTPGQEVSFCGLDCHLHVSVMEVRPGADLAVTVQFASNAVAAPEYPRELRFRLRDAAGHEFAPVNSLPDSALRAGQRWPWQLRFPATADPRGAVLIVTWDGVLDYFVPGTGNPLVQRRSRLALPPAKERYTVRVPRRMVAALPPSSTRSPFCSTRTVPPLGEA